MTDEKAITPQENVDGAKQLSEDQLGQVAGGAAYIKFDGIDGEANNHGPEKWIDPGASVGGTPRRTKP